MSHFLFLGLDQGSTSTKACLIDEQDQIVWNERVAVETTQPARGCVEQDANELLRSLQRTFSSAQEFAREGSYTIASVGLTLQRSGVMAWEPQSGKALSSVLTWRDNRARDRVEQISEYHQDIYDSTGLMPASGLAAPKIALLQEQFSSNEGIIGTPDGYYVRHLSYQQTPVIEESLAQRSLLYSWRLRSWDEQLCSLWRVDRARLPKIQPSFSSRGAIEGVPWNVILGDGQAALYALSAQGYRSTYNLGTKGLLLLPIADLTQAVPRYLTSIFFSQEARKERPFGYRYCVEGGTNACGQSFSEICQTLNLAEESISELASRGESQLVCFCPFREITTPDWIPHPPDLVRCNRVWTPADFAQGLTENVGNFVLEDLFAMREANLITALEIVPFMGGVANNDYLLQYVADCLGSPVGRGQITDAAAYGVALASKNEHQQRDHLKFQAGNNPRKTFARIFEPQNDKRRERFEEWKAVKRASLKRKSEGLFPYEQIRRQAEEKRRWEINDKTP